METRPTRVRVRVLAYALLLALAGCGGDYDPSGPVPESKHPPAALLWSDADVDTLVAVRYERIPALMPLNDERLSAACNEVAFLRFKLADASEDASEADAALLMVPGILEGANGFEYIGRQLVYMAKTQYQRDIEVWALDRRANCLEDLTGMQAAERAATAQEAIEIMLDYYYEGGELDGRRFEGFLRSADMPYLAEFGLAQTTSDMYAVIKHLIPDPAVSRGKVFVGGHSLGGFHTSTFLSWDFDGDPDTLEDAGYNLVAGAFGFDTTVASLRNIPELLSTTMPYGEYLLPLADMVTEAGYLTAVQMIRSGWLPRYMDIPGLFSSEVVALPEIVGILAATAPEEEHTGIHYLPKSPELRNIFRLFSARDAYSYGHGPHLEHFRFTNEVAVGQMFDDDLAVFSFLQAGLGHLHGGPVVEKDSLVEIARYRPLLKLLALGVSAPGVQQYAPADAGPSRKRFGEGPLYTWAAYDEIGTAYDPSYTDASGEYVFTTLGDEPVPIDSFIRALHIGPTNLTEWYFPTRILADLVATAFDFAPRHGIDTYHHNGPDEVPSILFIAENGVFPNVDAILPAPRARMIMLPGASHMDPMFAAVNTPDRHQNQVASNLLDFVFANVGNTE